MRKYEAYVDSEIEWVGEMPSHWKKIRHKNVFNKAQDIVGEDSSKYDVLSLTIRGVIKRDIESNIGKMPASFDGYQIVKPNSLLLCLFDIDVTPRCIGYVNQDGITTSAYTNIKVKNNTFYAKYYYYWFLMLDMDKTLLHLSKNLRNSIGITEFMALTTIYPPVNEQKKISCYLDKKIKEIDDTVALMNIYIEKVLENRQSIITEAVTKGLNPNVKMKDSSVEWIDEIPEHWEIKALKYCFKVGNGKEIDVELDIENESGINVYGSGGIFKKTNKVLFEGESVLFGRKGTIGKPLYVNDVFWTVDTMYYTKFYKKSYPKWFYYLLLVYPWDLIVTQTALPSVVGSDVANTICAIPSFREQVEIAEYLSLRDEKHFKLVENINNQIQKLKEYRQALIYEAVTGKIDVRDMELD